MNRAAKTHTKNAAETVAAGYAYTYDLGDNLMTKVEP